MGQVGRARVAGQAFGETAPLLRAGSRRLGKRTMDYTTEILVDGLGFPESPRWHEGRLWFSDQHLDRVMAVDLRGELEVIAEVPGSPSGLGWLPDGRLLIVSMKDKRLLRLDPQGLVVAADLGQLATHTCNDMIVDHEGNAFIGNFGYEIGDPLAEPRFAEIILVRPNGEAGIVAHGMAFPNGCVITPDHSTLIVAESSAARLTAFTITLEGLLVERRIWAEFDKRGLVVDQDRLIPDGICCDSKGAIWVASPGTPGGVLRVLEGGEVTDRVQVEHQAFAAMLGGPERKTLFVCTSTYDEDNGVQGRIEMVDVEVPGAGLP